MCIRDRLSDAHWTRLHVFPYSERPGTKALQLEGVVPRGERKRRAAELREMSLGRWRQKAQEQIGRNKKILVLNSSQGIRGLSRDYWDVVVTDDVQYASRWRGQEIDVRITGLGPERSNQMEPPLLAEVVL
ncbi:MAG: tRNA (N(6)-L-threonylcarbamoyladenosine(37)-C(2))-methylthiotransferase MtaB, partial [Bdellovibrionaceae bacterium]|nr:tRNA (N(6)-L-threonylcarbamoyladenosine(37)-C(2))-methylthiotransferase MtaB [Pseudobdellovibrionaceae bacterium]